MKTQVILFALTLLSTSLFANANYPAPTDVVKNYFTAVDAGNSAEIEKVLADDLWCSAPFLPQAVNKQTWLGVVAGLKIAFPDMKHEAVDIIESGNKIAVRGIATGQNNGSFMGNPPTGNRINFGFNTIFELDKTWKISRIYVQFDQKTMEAQLMAGLPTPAAATEATVRGLLAASDAGDVEKVLSYCSANSVHHFPGGATTSQEDLKKCTLAFKTGFPDIRRGIEELTVSGSTVVVRGWVTGTNTGMFAGKPATGQKVKVSWTGIYKLDASGKVAEAWVEFDRSTVEQQLRGEGSMGAAQPVKQ